MTALEKSHQPALADLAETDEPSEAQAWREPLSSIDEIPVRVAAVLGKTRIDIASLSALREGAIITLDRRVGEPIDLYVNDRLIARGELVMVDGALGVTMTEIVGDPAE